MLITTQLLRVAVEGAAQAPHEDGVIETAESYEVVWEFASQAASS